MLHQKQNCWQQNHYQLHHQLLSDEVPGKQPPTQYQHNHGSVRRLQEVSGWRTHPHQHQWCDSGVSSFRFLGVQIIEGPGLIALWSPKQPDEIFNRLKTLKMNSRILCNICSCPIKNHVWLHLHAACWKLSSMSPEWSCHSRKRLLKSLPQIFYILYTCLSSYMYLVWFTQIPFYTLLSWS